MILLSKHTHFFKKNCLGLGVWGGKIRGYSAKCQFTTLFIKNLNSYKSLTTHLDLDYYGSNNSEKYWASEYEIYIIILKK